MIKKIKIGCIGLLLSATTVFALNETHSAKVLEVKTAEAYTYLKVNEKDDKYWIAIQKSQIKVGDIIDFKEEVWMQNFKSKALNKFFEKIMFAQVSSDKIVGMNDIHNIHGDMIKKKVEEKKPDVKFNDGLVISKEKPIKTDISSLYKEKDKLKNKNVEVKGDVLQVSNKVMGNTWVKIYDGKKAVIFRSANEDEKIKPGDSVSVVGTLNTDIDFGHGYKYEVLGINSKFNVLTR